MPDPRPRSPLRIDLHAHSDRSDGTDDPGGLVARAAAAGIDVLGLTDHDTYAGWDAAAEAATTAGVALVRGVEISCRYRGTGVHLLGYLPDPGFQPLLDLLARIVAGRARRLPATVDRLVELGIPITLAQVRATAGPAAALGRPHVADVLVRGGVVADRAEAFDRFLAVGRPAYVERFAAELTDAIRLVGAAGGAPVLAHPRGRGAAAVVTDDVIARLAGAGLVGLEVDHPGHDASTRAGLRALADQLGLVVTGASDYHGTGKAGHPLGANVTAPAMLDRLLRAATTNAAAAGLAGTAVVA